MGCESTNGGTRFRYRERDYLQEAKVEATGTMFALLAISSPRFSCLLQDPGETAITRYPSLPIR